jgi:hypothetical protein
MKLYISELKCKFPLPVFTLSITLTLLRSKISAMNVPTTEMHSLMLDGHKA